MNILRFIAKLTLLLVGLLCIYLALSQVISTANHSVKDARDGTASAAVLNAYISETPFGEPAPKLKRNTQAFYNMTITRTLGQPCYVRTSWRWVLHLPTGNSVMWVASDGEFYTGDKNENLSQAFDVSSKLIPGKYTLSRLSLFKCGDEEEFARVVRNTDLIVE